MKIKIIFIQLFLILTLLNFGTQNLSAQSISDIPITTDSRIKTLVYNPNEVYQLKFYYGYQSFIEFSDDESIEMISLGEAFAWKITPSGKRLFIRPLEIAAHTNMAIITNKRAYQFDIQSAEYDGRADQELVYVVRFFYPDGKLPKAIPQQLSQPNPANKVQAQRMPTPQPLPIPAASTGAVIRSPTPKLTIDGDLKGALKLNDASNKINFNYQFAGNAPDITPIKVFDNGQETSFQFKNNNLVIPSINMVDIFGNEIPISYVIKDNYVVVPNVSTQFTLRLADSVLCIFNNKLSR